MTAVKEEEGHVSSTFNEDNWYRIPCLLGTQSSYEIYICRKLLTSPCVCCGQDHPEARIVRNKETGEEHGEYICDVSRVYGKSFREATSANEIYRHVPCPQKFALRNGYQLSDVASSWDTFMEKGYGHHISYRKLRTLWEEIKTIFEEEKDSWTFTRDVSWKPKTIDGEEDRDDTPNEDESDDPPVSTVEVEKEVNKRQRFNSTK